MNSQRSVKTALGRVLFSPPRWFNPKGRRSLLHWLSTTPFNLKSKLVVLFSLLFVMVIFMVSYVSLNHQKDFLAQEVEKRGQLIANNLSVSSRDAVLGRDLLTLSSLIGAIQKDKDVAYAYIVDHRSIILMHSDVTKISAPFVPSTPTSTDRSNNTITAQTQIGTSPIIEITQPIQYGKKTIGHVHIGINQAGVQAIMQQAKNSLLWTMGWGLFLGMGGILFLAHMFLRPVTHLVKATEEVTSGNLEIWIPVKSRDELGQLGNSFNSMTTHLKAAYEEVERGYMETTRALAAAVEAKDSYTQGHCGRVSHYAVEIGNRLGLSRHDLKELELAAILHDIGKIGVKDEILMKPGRLSFEEMRIMHLHPEIGRRILENVEPLQQVATDILCHHEFINGKGYPLGLKGEKIPVISRIITVADSYDSMSSKRPYRGPLSEDEVRRRLLAGKGRQFDPLMVDAFLDLYDAGLIQKIKNEPHSH
ncbi:MAG: HD domain-containing protein [Nitrospira sp.]|nr:HD domain-containing protein [Nitrospira sp.]